MRSLLSLILLFLAAGQHIASAQAPALNDSDHDGLSDRTEQALLEHFVPTFLVAKNDCSNLPAEFTPDLKTPTILRENGTIYGQAFLSSRSTPNHPLAELHYYHLWRADCGPHGHHLDTEHVAVLVAASSADPSSASWLAEYWYAAAHEDTVCDVSQITRASTLHAQDHGPNVWISPGKHASFLNDVLCNRGCGADRCVNMIALPPANIINLGEIGAPMNGSAFIASIEWPLASKMKNSNFPEATLTRLERLPATDIAWSTSGRHPTRQIIAISSSTERTLADGSNTTTAAVAAAGDNTDVAISVAGKSTGKALHKSYTRTKDALSTSARHVGQALHVTPRQANPE